MKELISIIIPVYNTEIFLPKCINSVLNQTYQNLEILLINDGSTDNSLAILNEYAKKDSRIKVVTKENSGVSSTRNYGISISSGTYLMFVDSDDVIVNTCCSDLLELITKNNSQIVMGNIVKDTNQNKIDVIEEINYDQNSINNLIKCIYQNNLKNIEYIESPVCKLYNRAFLLNNNLLFRSNLKYGEDSIFNLECYLKCSSVSLITKKEYIYTTNLKSASYVKSYTFKDSIDQLLINHKQILINNNLFDNFKSVYYIYAFRQIQKVIRLVILKNDKSRLNFKKYLNEEPIKEIIYNLDNNMISKKSIIKKMVLKYHLYFMAKIIWSLK